MAVTAIPELRIIQEEKRKIIITYCSPMPPTGYDDLYQHYL
jgi:hypothetical protein